MLGSEQCSETNLVSGKEAKGDPWRVRVWLWRSGQVVKWGLVTSVRETVSPAGANAEQSAWPTSPLAPQGSSLWLRLLHCCLCWSVTGVFPAFTVSPFLVFRAGKRLHGAAVRVWFPERRVCVSQLPSGPCRQGWSSSCCWSCQQDLQRLALNSRDPGEEWSSAALVSQNQLVTAHKKQLVRFSEFCKPVVQAAVAWNQSAMVGPFTPQKWAHVKNPGFGSFPA